MMDQSMAPVSRPDFGDTRVDALQHQGFGYFLNETNPANSLVTDRTQPGAPASITAVGFALAAYPVGVKQAWMTTTRPCSCMRSVSALSSSKPRAEAASCISTVAMWSLGCRVCVPASRLGN